MDVIRMNRLHIASFLIVLFGICVFVMPVYAGTSPDLKMLFKTTTDSENKQVELSLHIFKPEGWTAEDRRPVVVFFFGGGWSQGDPKQFFPQCAELAERGMVAASAEYRVKSRHGTTPLACIEDGKSAVRFLRANAAKLGIDPDRVVAGGGSAGAHVAACSGVLKGYDAEGEDQAISSVPNLMILFNPVIDTKPETGYGSIMVPGDDPSIISPVDHVAKGQPPALILHGTADTTTPIPSARRFVQLSNEMGIASKIVEFEGEKHSFFNNGGYRPAEEGKPNYHRKTMDEVLSFLTKHGYIEKAD